MTDENSRVAHAVARAAENAGARVFAHALDLETGAETGVDADDAVVAASVFKVPVLIEYVRQVEAGELDPARPIRIPAGSPSPGPTGLSVFTGDTEWSLRDLATSMITVSDNAASDIVTALVGLDRVNATLDELGLPGTRVVEDCAGIYASIAEDFGTPDPADAWRILEEEPERAPGIRATIPDRTNRTTPREATRLMQLIWTDRAAPAAGCAEARRILGLQVWSHRLSTGFPGNRIRISAKTGTLGVVRNESGVVEFPDGRRYAVAVFVRSHAYRRRDAAADALIGTVARLLVDDLAARRV